MKETVTDPLLFFLVSILFGVCLQAIYDIIRGIRRVFYHKSVFLFIEDIGFGIFTAVMAFIFLCTYNDGELRGFFFLGIVIGMILYYQLCSKFLLRAVIHITEKLKKIIRQFEKVCLRPGIHIKRNLKWQLKKEKKQVTMALKKQIKRGGKSDNSKETKSAGSEDKDHHDHCSDICSHFSIFLYQSTTEIKEDRQRAAAGGIPDQETRREEKRIKEEKRIYQDKRIY